MIRTGWVRSAALLGTLAATALLVWAAAASANVPLTRVSTDPFTNPTSQHAREVEPDTFASGSTVVGDLPGGSLRQRRASDIGYARSRDSGAHWDQPPGFLPGLTFNAGQFSNPGNPFEAVATRGWLLTQCTTRG